MARLRLVCAVLFLLLGTAVSLPFKFASNQHRSSKGVSYVSSSSSHARSARSAAEVNVAAFKPDVVVAQDGSGNFKTIQAAINALPVTTLTRRRSLVYVKAGSYDELVTIPENKPYITMVGDAGRTTVRMDRTAGKMNASGLAMGTVNTATFTVFADDFTMINMVVLNSAPRPPPAVVGGQAVAFMSTANRTLAYNCTFRSFQDTLYAKDGMQYYKNCFIAGSIDFVFGNARAIFDGCKFYMDSMGYAGVTAHHKTDQYDHTCFIIINSNITGRNQGWLGRPWGKYACTIVAYSNLDAAVAPEGWNDFNVKAREVTSFFAEYMNTGVGSVLDGRVWWEKVLTPAQRVYYLTTDYIGLRAWMKPLVIAPPHYMGRPNFTPARQPPSPPPPVVVKKVPAPAPGRRNSNSTIAVVTHKPSIVVQVTPDHSVVSASKTTGTKRAAVKKPATTGTGTAAASKKTAGRAATVAAATSSQAAGRIRGH